MHFELYQQSYVDFKTNRLHYALTQAGHARYSPEALLRDRGAADETSVRNSFCRPCRSCAQFSHFRWVGVATSVSGAVWN
jgi:hypothetical protein